MDITKLKTALTQLQGLSQAGRDALKALSQDADFAYLNTPELQAAFEVFPVITALKG